MVKKISKYTEMGPAIYYSLLAVFCAVIYLLGSSPSSALLWEAYFVFAPVMRGPVHLVWGWIDLHIIQLLAISVYVAFSGFFTWNQRFHRFRFFYFHTAFLLMIHSIFQERNLGGFAASGNRFELITPAVTKNIIGEFLSSMSSFNPLGLVMLFFVTLACVSWHVRFIDRMRANHAG